MAKLTLDEIRRMAEQKYAPAFVVEGVDGGDVTLVSPLRLSKDKRDRLRDMQSAEDQSENVSEMIRLVAATPADADRLLKAIPELPEQVAVLTSYGEAIQMGEASNSPA